MLTHDFSPKDSRNTKGKNTQLVQYKRVYLELFKKSQTMKQVSVSLGIDRANITRYCAKLRKTKSVAYLKKVICPITKHWAFLVTTNPQLFPKHDIQLQLFQNEND